jgi:PRTRC genetic system protein E
MLITSLVPLLSRYSLGFDLVAGPDGTVTLTVIPRKAEGTAGNLESGEVRPISITALAAEIDDELAKGADGALGQLITARKALGDQIAEQHAATKAAAPKPKAAAATPSKTPATAAAPAPAPPAEPKPGEPASLW